MRWDILPLTRENVTYLREAARCILLASDTRASWRRERRLRLARRMERLAHDAAVRHRSPPATRH